MAANIDNPQGPVAGASKAPKSRHRHGLLTPEGTPAPDDARIAADKERSARETGQQGIMPPITEIPDGGAAQSKPAFDVGSQDDQDSDSDDSDNEGVVPPTEAQVDAVNHVLACDPKDYRKILKLEPGAEDSVQDKENIVNSFRHIGCLTHPDFNKTKGADQAFKRLLKTAKKLGIDQEDVNEVKFWDGETLGELHLTADGKWVDKADSMEGIENLPTLGPTEVHQQIWRDVKPALGRLMDNPHDEEAVATLKEANTKIVAENVANKVPEAMLHSYTIAIDTFKATFIEATPILARLRENPADGEARGRFDALNNRLRDFNRLHGYPAEWIMDPPAANPSGPAIEENGQQTSTVSLPPIQTGDNPGYRRCSRREGYVREDGVEKKIEGWLKVGGGHQVVISHAGENGLTIYEKAPASTFGKGFGEAYSKRPNANAIRMGTAEELRNKKFDEMVIAGVASDRRDPGKEPVGGWVQQAKTIVLVAFGDNPTKFTWYTRSTLGQSFGQALIDEYLIGFRREAHQDEPLAPTRRASRPRKAPRVGSQIAPQPLQSNGIPENPVENSMAALMAKLKELEGQIKQLSEDS